MKRLNIKLLAGLIAGSFLCAVSVYLLHGFQVKRNAQTLLQRAAQHRQEGDLKETLRIMRRYLAHRPGDAEQFKVAALDARDQLYHMVEQREPIEKPQFDLAIFLIEEAVRKNGNDPEMRRAASDFWSKMNKHDWVIDNLEPIRNSWTTDDLMLYIDALQRTGEESTAIGELEQLVGFDPATGEFDVTKAKHPELLEAYSSLAQLVVRKSLDLNLAEKTANQLVNANEDNYEAFLMRSRLLPFIRGAEGQEQAYADIQRAFEMNPDSVDTMLAMASMYLDQNDAEQAKQHVTDGLAKADSRFDKSRLYNMWVTIAIRSGEMDEALKIVEQGLAAVPYDSDLSWMKARLLLDQKKYKEVEAMTKDLQRAKISAPMIEYLQARILMDHGDYRGATKRLAKIRPTVSPLVQYEIDAYLSAGYAKTGQLDLRLATVKRMIQARPDDTAAQEQLVVTLDLLNRSQEALNYLRDVINQLNREGKPVPATMKNIETSLDMKVTFGTAVAKVDKEDVDRIKKNVTDVWRNEEIPELTRRAMVVDLFRKLDRPEDARKWIRDGLDKDRSSFGLWALALDFANDAEEARATLAEMEKAFAQDHELEMRSMRARLAVKYDPVSAAKVIRQQQENVDGFTQDELASLYYELGSLQLILQDRDDGLRLLELASQNAPKRLDIVTAIFDEAKRGADAAKVMDAVKRIEAITGRDDDTWRMAEAGSILWRLNHEDVAENQRAALLGKARGIVQDVRRSRPEWLPAIIEESSIHLAGGDFDAALQSLLQAHELQPTNPQIIRLIAQSYKDRGENEEARRWMARLPLAMRNSNDNRAALSLLWERRDAWTQAEMENALRLVEEVAPMSTETAMDLVWRSQVLLKAGQLDDAELAARRAKELDRALPETWTNLVSVLMARGEAAKADVEMQEAAAALPDDVRPIVLGRGYAILGDQQRAQSNFQEVLQQDPSNTMAKRLMAESLFIERNATKAQEVLDDILKTADPANDQEHLAWARRRKALLLADTNVFAAFNEALDLIEQNQVDGELQGDDLMIWLTLCARRPEKQSWERAILRLDRLAESRPLTPSQQFLKASLLEKYGDTHWEQVQQITTELLARGGSNQQWIETWVKWLLKRGQVQQAKTWAANNLDPNSITKITIDVNDLAARGNVEDALQRLASRTPRELDSAQKLAVTLAVANIAETAGQYDQRFYDYAEQQFERIQQVIPNQVLLWARSMGLNSNDPNKVKQAIELCMTADQKKVPKSASASVLISILRDKQDRLNSELAQLLPALTQWFNQARTENSSDLALTWEVAAYFDLISDFDRAEAEYQAIIDAPTVSSFDRGVAMNNLAYAMALNGKRDKPLRLIADAEQLLGPTGDIIDTRGYVRLVRREFDKAVEDFQLAIRNGINVAPKYFHLALALNLQGKATDAETAWKQALQAGLSKLTIHPALHDDFDKFSGQFGGAAVATNF